MCFGIGYYGTFVTSLYTMFQILTGESWSEGCVWPLLDFFMATNPEARKATMLFFVSFVLITNFVLLNVVVTVLIDGMNQAVDEPKAEGSDPEGREALLRLKEEDSNKRRTQSTRGATGGSALSQAGASAVRSPKAGSTKSGRSRSSSTAMSFHS